MLEDNIMTWRDYEFLICKLCLYENVTNQQKEWIEQLANWVLQTKVDKSPSKRQLEYEYFSAFESLTECAWTTSHFWTSIEEGEYSQVPPLKNYLGAARKVYAFTEVFQPWCLQVIDSTDEIDIKTICDKIYEFTLIEER